MTAVPKNPPHRDRDWLDYVATLPCIFCGAKDGTVVGAHSGHAFGLNVKDHDWAAIPACARHHRELDGAGNWKGGKEKYLVEELLRKQFKSAYDAWRDRA